MKRKRAALVIAAVLAIAVISGLWYARPLTIEELCPGLDLAQCTGIYAAYSTYDGRGLENRIALEPEEGLPPLLELFQDRQFRRSPLWWIPSGSKSHRWQEGEFRWSIDFEFQEAPVTDFSAASGYLLSFNNFFGKLEMRFMGETRPVRMTDQEQWLEDVLDCILALEPNNNPQSD